MVGALGDTAAIDGKALCGSSYGERVVHVAWTGVLTEMRKRQEQRDYNHPSVAGRLPGERLAGKL